jgi:2-haloacid dehalogenase
MTFVPEAFPIQPGPNRSPAPGALPIRAFVFDTYGTVCDFYRPLARGFERLARKRGISCDAGRLAVEWRNAYARSTFMAAGFGMEFRPLKEIHRENLIALAANAFSFELDEAEIGELVALWNALDPWPDAVEGLRELKKRGIVAPLSNGNFDDMIALARHAGLPWDAILGSSVARAYKPHPDIYLRSVEALNLRPGNVCMVAAHQVDLAYAAGHGMQTAFVVRADEFGGAIKPKDPEPGFDVLSAAEVHAEAEWTFVVESFVELASKAM